MKILVNKYQFLLGIIFALIIPLGLTVHGIIWHDTAKSSSLIIYGIKLSSLIFILPVFLKFGISPFVNTPRYRIFNFIFLTILFLGLIMPLFCFDSINWFYYLADFTGIMILFLTITYIRFLLVRGLLSVNQIFSVFFLSVLLISISIIFNYIYSNGSKVSTPPEIHYGLAIYFFTLVLNEKKHKLHSFIPLLIIFLGVFLSYYRMNMIIAIGALLSAFFFVNKKKITLRILVIGIVFIVVGVFNKKIVLDRIEDLKLERISKVKLDGETINVVKDKAVNQRFIEIQLILDDIFSKPYLIRLLGKGFGAQYENKNKTISYYNKYEHSAHVSIFVILLRNGLFGVACYMMSVVYFFKKISLKNTQFLTATIGLFFTYIALLTDQYIYWGFSLGIGVAVWQYLCEKEKILDEV